MREWVNKNTLWVVLAAVLAASVVVWIGWTNFAPRTAESPAAQVPHNMEGAMRMMNPSGRPIPGLPGQPAPIDPRTGSRTPGK